MHVRVACTISRSVNFSTPHAPNRLILCNRTHRVSTVGVHGVFPHQRTFESPLTGVCSHQTSDFSHFFDIVFTHIFVSFTQTWQHRAYACGECTACFLCCVLTPHDDARAHPQMHVRVACTISRSVNFSTPHAPNRLILCNRTHRVSTVGVHGVFPHQRTFESPLTGVCSHHSAGTVPHIDDDSRRQCNSKQRFYIPHALIDTCAIDRYRALPISMSCAPPSHPLSTLSRSMTPYPATIHTSA